MKNFWLDLRRKRLDDSKKSKDVSYPKHLWEYVARLLANRKKP